MKQAMVAGLLVVAQALASLANAEPYIAVREGLHCVQCHVDPGGGGLRTVFGNTFAQTQFPARRENPEQLWTGMVGTMLQLGGNLRGSASYTDAPEQDDTWEFDLDEFRAYANLILLPQRLEIYVDEHIAPDGTNNLEAYLKYTMANGEWYARAGKLYLPYGWRLEDDGAYIRQVTGINFDTPDDGVEVGWLHGGWSAQLSLTNGTAGGPETDDGKQISGRLEYLRGWWRVGASGNFNNSDAGDRTMGGLFAGLRTGPVSWLAEADYIEDESPPTGRRKEWVGLLEANWLMRKGHNLKLTAEYFEPDVDVDEDEQNRFSLLWEYAPMEFLQLRTGVRSYDGIPQNPQQNRTEAFVQLHGFF
jgi:hypothetical protein